METPVNADRIVSPEGGVKDDARKLLPLTLPRTVLDEVYQVLTYGAQKYERDNWKKLEVTRLREAAERHWHEYLLYIEDGCTGDQATDPESHMNHLSHAITNLIMIRWLDMNEADRDDASTLFEQIMNRINERDMEKDWSAQDSHLVNTFRCP